MRSINPNIKALELSLNERNIHFKAHSLVLLLESFYTDFFAKAGTKKVGFDVEKSAPEFAKLLESYFEGLNRLKFNRIFKLEDLKSVEGIDQKENYYEHLEQQGYLVHSLVENQYYEDKKNLEPDIFSFKLLPEEYLSVGTERAKVLDSLQKKLEKQSEVNHYRYHHTLNMVKSFSAVINRDYELFLRLDDVALRRGETPLTKNQFLKICDVWDSLLVELERDFNGPSFEKEKNKMILFFLILLLTHDMGIRHPTDDAGHAERSGKACKKVLAGFNFSRNEAVLAEVINANHQYLGDLSIGEGTFAYYKQLLQELDDNGVTDGWRKHFFKLLWLLSMIDINEAHGGFLSRQKFDFLQGLQEEQGYELKLQNKKLKEERIKLLEQNYMESRIEAGEVDPLFAEVYLQYFIDFLKTTGPDKAKAFLDEKDAVRLINRITELFKLTKVSSFKPYKFITFTKRASGKQGLKVIAEIAGVLESGKITVTDAERGEGFFLGYRFRVSYPYLYIDNEILFK